MEVVYFLISVIEIVLTIFIVKKILPAIFKIEEKNNLIVKNLPIFYKAFEKIKNILKASSYASKAYKKATYYKKYIDKIMTIKSIVGIIEFLKGKRTRKKFNPFVILRKLFFFV